MFPLEVYKRLREEQSELAVRIGKLKQFIDNHDNKLNDDYKDILRNQLNAMKAYNSCLVYRIGIAVTEGIAPQERSRGNQAIRRDVNKFRESCEPDPRDPDPKQDSDRVAACEDYCNFNGYFDPAPKQDSDKVVADDADAHNFLGFHVERWTDVL